MKKLIRDIIALLAIAVLMFAEYRFIMVNLSPSVGDNNTIYIDFMRQVDEYECE